MLVALTVIFGTVAFMLLIIIGYDVIAGMIDKYSHYHIGHWGNTNDWESAVLRRTKKWLLRTPVLRIRDDNRYLLIDRLTGKNGKSMVQSWQKAGCFLGVFAVEEKASELEIVKHQLLNDNGTWKKVPDKVDFCMLAYALLKSEKDSMVIKPAMDAMIRCVEDNLCSDGMVSYSGGKNSYRRYVDTLGFICPFLCLYGRIYNKPKYIELAINQVKLFKESGIYHDLPVHCFQSGTGIPLGIYGWGRGIGWYTLALTDIHRELEEAPEKNYIQSCMSEIADTIALYERKDGGFSTIITVDEHYDSSATAMLGYFFAYCNVVFFEKEYYEIAMRSLEKLIKKTKLNGVVDECLGDTKDLGVFSQRYGAMPFVQGMALRLCSEIQKGVKQCKTNPEHSILF